MNWLDDEVGRLPAAARGLAGGVRRDRHRHGAEAQAGGQRRAPVVDLSRCTGSSGVNAPLIPQNDFLQGDFYGDSWQGSFVRKLLEDLTPHRPFGFETSFSHELADHTAMKPEALLEAKASAAIADGAAFIFIDAIDPIGTLNPRVYDRMGRIFDRLMPYYGELGGKRVADVAVYYSLDSKFDFAGNGRPVAGADTHRRAYQERHRGHPGAGEPSHPVRRRSPGDRWAAWTEHKVLILPNVNMMDDDEIEAIRALGAPGRQAAGHRLDVARRHAGPDPQGLRPGRRLRRQR